MSGLHHKRFKARQERPWCRQGSLTDFPLCIALLANLTLAVAPQHCSTPGQPAGPAGQPLQPQKCALSRRRRPHSCLPHQRAPHRFSQPCLVTWWGVRHRLGSWCGVVFSPQGCATLRRCTLSLIRREAVETRKVSFPQSSDKRSGEKKASDPLAQNTKSGDLSSASQLQTCWRSCFQQGIE